MGYVEISRKTFLRRQVSRLATAARRAPAIVAAGGVSVAATTAVWWVPGVDFSETALRDGRATTVLSSSSQVLATVAALVLAVGTLSGRAAERTTPRFVRRHLAPILVWFLLFLAAAAIAPLFVISHPTNTSVKVCLTATAVGVGMLAPFVVSVRSRLDPTRDIVTVRDRILNRLLVMRGRNTLRLSRRSLQDLDLLAAILQHAVVRHDYDVVSTATRGIGLVAAMSLQLGDPDDHSTESLAGTTMALTATSTLAIIAEQQECDARVGGELGWSAVLSLAVPPTRTIPSLVAFQPIEGALFRAVRTGRAHTALPIIRALTDLGVDASPELMTYILHLLIEVERATLDAGEPGLWLPTTEGIARIARAAARVDAELTLFAGAHLLHRATELERSPEERFALGKHVILERPPETKDELVVDLNVRYFVWELSPSNRIVDDAFPGKRQSLALPVREPTDLSRHLVAQVKSFLLALGEMSSADKSVHAEIQHLLDDALAVESLREQSEELMSAITSGVDQRVWRLWEQHPALVRRLMTLHALWEQVVLARHSRRAP